MVALPEVWREEAPSSELMDRARAAVRRARGYLLDAQRPEGCWHFPLEANATMDAQYVFFNRLVGRARPEVEARLAEHLLHTQNDEGAWPLFYGGAGNLSATIEAYFALKLTGRQENEPAMRRAREFVLAHGGAAKAGVFTRIFLAYFGQYPWSGVPALPPEIMLLPDRFPLSIYNMSSWARSTVVPLLVLLQKRPSARLEPRETIGELFLRPPTRRDMAFSGDPELLSLKNLFIVADVVFRLADRLPKRLRRRSLERASHWIVQRQDRNGGFGGIQPAMLNSVLALHALGCAVDHPAVAAGIQAIDDFLVERDGQLLFQPCVSPTWDTALTVRALVDSGFAADSSSVERATSWLGANQILRPGDWSVKNPALPPGGWAFELANDWYPDVDDSAVILMDLALAGDTSSEVFRRGLEWTLGMQSRNGGYAAFDTDNDREAFNRIPFADMEAMTDPPTEDLTGRLCELMGVLGFHRDHPRLRAARTFLYRTQRADGSWWGRWGVNTIYGTWSALCGLAAAGESEGSPILERGARFLERCQNSDGGFGETCESYVDPGLSGRGTSTASQTAWAILGLLAAGATSSRALQDGVDHLCRTQAADGSWREEEFTGTGFPRHFYLRYDGYRSFFPLMALGRYVQATARLR
jgi:squalene-hopene/tetraprenyl-beta-curcumene cyclase